MMFSFPEFLKKPIRRHTYPIYNWLTTIFFSHIYRDCLIRPNQWLYGQRGNDYEKHRRNVNRFIRIKDSQILIAGCGKCGDIPSWLIYKPRKITGVDYFDYDNEWDTFICSAKYKYPSTKIELIQQDLCNMSAIESSSVDIVASDAVFEHLTNFNVSIKEMYRVLKSGGLLYATFGPLWYSYGGDHISGYDHYLNGYNHLLLSDLDYQEYLNKMGPYTHSEDDGRTWIYNNLFSRMKPTEYLTSLQDSGFKRVYVAAMIDPRALKFLRHSPFKDLLKNKYKEYDLKICSLSLIYRKEN